LILSGQKINLKNDYFKLNSNTAKNKEEVY
jgi:hypothetical protein